MSIQKTLNHSVSLNFIIKARLRADEKCIACLIGVKPICTTDCNYDRFAYIVGYTSGGAAYGLQWEDVGIDPDLPFDEKVRLYQSETY